MTTGMWLAGRAAVLKTTLVMGGVLITGVAFGSGAVAASQRPAQPAASDAAALEHGSTTTPHYGTWGFNPSSMDRAATPGNDFYQYADGAALRTLQIPADRARWGYFAVLTELSQNRVRAILDEQAARADAAPNTSPEKIGAFYKAFMDEGRVERLGAAPMKRDLDSVRAVTSRAQLTTLMGRANDGFLFSIMGVEIDPDAKNPDRYSVRVSQSGLGLPDRDYYLTPQFVAQKAKYQQYVAQMLGLADWPDAQAQAKAIVDFETRIAQASWTRAEARDPEKTYNPTTVAALQGAAPGLEWRTLLDAAHLGSVSGVISVQNTALPRIAAIYQSTPLDTLKAWEAFHVIDNAAPYLSNAFVQAHFEFRNHVLSGQPQLQARWKRGVNTVTEGMGEAVGQIYVARYFPPDSKAQMQALVGDLKSAFRARLEGNTWMSPATKAEALRKLSGYTVRIGYPDRWRDYSSLPIRPDDLYGNVERSQAFEWARQVRRLDQPVDKTEWDMTPQEVNAYNMPEFNEVVFPAAILQPPFFDPKADAAVNYGAIGGVIGHEMTHGFDDQGRKFDDTGHLRDWWTPEDAKRFEARAGKLGAQYSSYEPLPGAHVNGALTMGENIADQGGLTLALDAYHASLRGRPAPVINGLTGDQRVFLGWAQVWVGKDRDDALREQVVSDPHSPSKYRVNGVVRNIDGWYAAFKVQPGQALYVAPADRAHIW